MQELLVMMKEVDLFISKESQIMLLVPTALKEALLTLDQL